MSQLKNDRLIRALRRQPVDRTPVWIMRQAGRYLPEYRAIRKQAGSFMALCTNPELACEVTLQPLRRFPLDAAILFSDILTIPDAMGLGLYFVEGEGPRFEQPIDSPAAIERLPRPDPFERLDYVMQAVRRIRSELDGSVPLIGFSGSPWTLATYMVEGGSSKNFGKVKGLLYGQPEAAHALLARLAEAVTDYLNAQIESGAQAVQVFDSWGGVLSPAAFNEFSLTYLQQIVDGIRPGPDGQRVPIILFCKGCNGHLEALADTGCDALGVDWTLTLGEARRRVGDRVALQGNLDPAVLLAPPEVVRTQVAATLDSFGDGEGHVFNLGHGITPDVNPDHLATLVDAVAELSPARHGGR
ncbi:MAG: uroporphyrinogen decarboxylase [Xanthomonadales bacterium]|nr:uroporphyrinogen decarboxylase [Xanthomonadales bacterium]NIN59989.1 uroporphyrinogen decarboxylase [Xanthomonadales bacterium]NIN74795.1 uroporphyrinogen decarboxylase [Xanthomonadales bacterium]NIO12766.1 uroporphyrinogen decarboxylase [Xanthomonadales bacterium]NIP12382.1 uroporphyrinogen decarboxylase [Xanthomonadales bacterium]